MIPTRRGLGVELWGTFDDLTELYEVIGKFWNDEEKRTIRGFANRDRVISVFSHDLRHAFMGSRLKISKSHFSHQECPYLGVQISWVQFLFSLCALRLNMSYIEANKYDLSYFLQMEYWLEKAMTAFDEEGAQKLIPFINGGIFAGNECLYQFMRSIDAEYFSLGGGKNNFRKLPDLLKRAVLFSKPYIAYMTHLTNEGIILLCEPDMLEVNDDDIPYGDLEW